MFEAIFYICLGSVICLVGLAIINRIKFVNNRQKPRQYPTIQEPEPKHKVLKDYLKFLNFDGNYYLNENIAVELASDGFVQKIYLNNNGRFFVIYERKWFDGNDDLDIEKFNSHCVDIKNNLNNLFYPYFRYIPSFKNIFNDLNLEPAIKSISIEMNDYFCVVMTDELVIAYNKKDSSYDISMTGNKFLVTDKCNVVRCFLEDYYNEKTPPISRFYCIKNIRIS